METISQHFIGLDVSKPILDVYILPAKVYFQVPNTGKGFQLLLKKLQHFSIPLIILKPRAAMRKNSFTRLTRLVLQSLS